MYGATAFHPSTRHLNDPLHPRWLPPCPSSYEIVAQSAAEVRDIQNAPAIVMGPYLIATDQLWLLTRLSIYVERGATENYLRLYYINDVALDLWVAMGYLPNRIGTVARPPRTALLAYGVPFGT